MEHMSFFSKVKGSSDISRDVALLRSVGLEGRDNHRPNELSGSERRKLALALAFCGDSKFIVLDGALRGMDLTSRRQIWKFLHLMKEERTILITSQNMDEVEAVADRVAIFDTSGVICLGSPQFLRNKYNVSFKFMCEIDNFNSSNANTVENIIEFVTKSFENSKFHSIMQGSLSTHLSFLFPRCEHKEALVAFLGAFKRKFSIDSSTNTSNLNSHGILHFDLRRATMADVFETAVPSASAAVDSELVHVESYIRDEHTNKQQQSSSWFACTTCICKRKLLYSMRDFVSITAIVYQWAVFILAAGYAFNITRYSEYLIGSLESSAVVCAIYVVAFIMVPGNIAQFVVADRDDGTRHLLLLSGVPTSAYWCGLFLADFIVQAIIPLGGLFLTWEFTSMYDLWPQASQSWRSCVVMIVFTVNCISFSYLFSFLFHKSATASFYLPILLIYNGICTAFGLLSVAAVSHSWDHYGVLSVNEAGGILLWIVTFASPHGAMFSGLLISVVTQHSEVSRLKSFPSTEECCIIMAGESFLYFLLVIIIDRFHLVKKSSPNGKAEKRFKSFDEGVIEEKRRVEDYMTNLSAMDHLNYSISSPAKPYLSPDEASRKRSSPKSDVAAADQLEYVDVEEGRSSKILKRQVSNLNADPNAVGICIDKLRVKFTAKQRLVSSHGANKRGQVIGLNDFSIAVNKGEIFGLVGGNGSGKNK